MTCPSHRPHSVWKRFRVERVPPVSMMTPASLLIPVAKGHVPQLDKVIVAPARQHFSVRAPVDADHVMRVPLEHTEITTIGGVPNTDRLVQDSAGHFRAIGTPHDAPQHCLLTRQLSTSRLIHPSMRKPSDAAGDFEVALPSPVVPVEMR